ncbi:MAG: pitrilysin family protein [Elusimicrobiota bacterium]
MKNNIKVKDMPNGLKAAVWEDHRSDVVEIRLYVKTGSVYEQEFSGSGISHFLEHVASEGPTGKRTKKEVDDLMKKFGDAYNAYTSKDHTCYHVTTVREYGMEAAALLGELVFDNIINEEAYKREKGVILREIEKSDEEPNRYMYKLESENLYTVHPARFPVIGYRELFEKISLDNLVSYYRTKYTPNNAVLVIGGDVDTAETFDFISRTYGVYERNFYTIPALPAEPSVLSMRESTGQMDVDGAYLNMSWLTIPLDHPDLYALDLLSEVLSSGRNAILNRVLKEEKEIVNKTDSYSNTPVYGKGQFTITARLKADAVYEAENAILDIISGIRDKGINQDDLERAKKLAVSSYLFSMTSVSGNTSRIGMDLISTGDPDYSREYVEKLNRVSREDVKNAALLYLTPQYVKTVVLPVEEEEITAGSSRDTEMVPESIVLNNGIRVILTRIAGISVIEYTVFLKGGQTYDGVYKKPGLSSFLGSAMSRGTLKRSREELADEFEKRGAGFSTSSGNNTFYLKAESLKEDYREILRLLKEILMEPAFDDEEMRKLKKFTVQAIEQQKDSWQKEAYLNFKKHIFPEDTPYTESELGTAGVVEDIKREDLIEIHSGFFVPGNMVVSIAGDFEPEKMKDEVKKIFSGIIGTGKEIPDYKESILKTPVAVTENYKTGKDMAVVFRGYPTVILTEIGERVVLDIIDAVISGHGYPGGWLHERLRGKELVYVVHAYNLNLIKSGCFAMFAATNPAQLEETLDVIDGVFNDLVSGKYTKSEIETAKNQIMIMDRVEKQSPGAIAEGFALNEVFGFGYDFDKKYIEMIRNTTREDIDRVVKKYFSDQEPVTVITSPAR